MAANDEMVWVEILTVDQQQWRLQVPLSKTSHLFAALRSSPTVFAAQAVTDQGAGLVGLYHRRPDPPKPVPLVWWMEYVGDNGDKKQECYATPEELRHAIKTCLGDYCSAWWADNILVQLIADLREGDQQDMDSNNGRLYFGRAKAN